jgi:hypothetical protein
MVDQSQLTTTFCATPERFAWFLGAGASAVAGLPTAWDVIWDLKKRYYSREENEDISRQDVQVDAVRARIQAYMLSKGFPDEGSPGEYTTYFEKIFGADKERQRRYLTAFLSEEKVSLSAGNRVLAALMAMGKARVIFTTNFDSVLERALADVSGRSLSAYHLEGSASANNALSNEEFPFYCKLHGDFRYDSIKNLRSDLASQDEDLSRALINAANRFGFIIAGYSGRDESVMNLLRSALSTHNPFPHGLFWTGMKSARVLPAVEQLIEQAQKAGVDASYVEVETFDALMLRLWRNIEDKDPALDNKVRKSYRAKVSIPLPESGEGSIIRMNALPITSLPGECHAVMFKGVKEWGDLREATAATQGRLIFTKGETVLCWGQEALIRSHFPDVVSISPYDLSAKITDISAHLHVKGFLEDAMGRALARGKPALIRSNRTGTHLIADAHSEDQSGLAALQKVVGKTAGQIVGLFAPVDDDHPAPEKVFWAEALRVSIDIVNGRSWLLLDPDVWIWPQRARKDAATFLSERRRERYNNVYNDLLEAWISILLPSEASRDREVKLSAFESGTSAESPSFRVATRTAYTRRLVA